MDDPNDCPLAEGFSVVEKVYAQGSFFSMGIIGTFGIIRVDWIMVLPYVVVYWYGVPGIIMRHLNCPRCPHLHTYGDCLQFPPKLSARLVKRKKTTPFGPVENALFWMIALLIPTYPVYWLWAQPILLAVFVSAAGLWYGGQLFYFCKRCRVEACPLNRAGAVPKAI